MEQELFHIHKVTNKNDHWSNNKIVNINDNYNSIMNQRHQNFSQLVNVFEGGSQEYINFSFILADYMRRINNLSVIKNDDIIELKRLLEIGYQMTYNADLFRREEALENYRKDNLSHLPSRLHAMYLCDNDGIEYWQDVISQNDKIETETYRVLASGDIFKTNEQLLPSEISTYQETYQQAFKYWNPKFKNLPNYTNEYLIRGKIKVLEKI